MEETEKIFSAVLERTTLIKIFITSLKKVKSKLKYWRAQAQPPHYCLMHQQYIPFLVCLTEDSRRKNW